MRKPNGWSISKTFANVQIGTIMVRSKRRVAGRTTFRVCPLPPCSNNFLTQRSFKYIIDNPTIKRTPNILLA